MVALSSLVAVVRDVRVAEERASPVAAGRDRRVSPVAEERCGRVAVAPRDLRAGLVVLEILDCRCWRRIASSSAFFKRVSNLLDVSKFLPPRPMDMGSPTMVLELMELIESVSPVNAARTIHLRTSSNVANVIHSDLS